MSIFAPPNLWIWCVLSGHNPDKTGKCRRCGERENEASA